ncbi:MAG: DNA translocase FtsK 4TM domain-containing protein [Moraxella sp.]|nr:DNA translocase FtsK 4TM domain-containing protein [Moraxella sp.]
MQKIFDEETLHKIADKILYLRQGFVVAVGCLVSLYLFLILLSYSPADSAWSHISSQNLSEQVHNIGGVSGAYLADWLRTFFGLGSWAVLGWSAYETYRGYHQHSSTIAVVRLFAYLFMWVCVCVLLSAVGAKNGQQLYFGGIVGHELYAGLVGLMGVLMTVVFCSFMLGCVLWLLIERHKRQHRRKSVSSSITQMIAKHDDTSQQTAQSNTPQQSSGNYQNHEPHQHRGALESFLTHSGLRDDLQAHNEMNETAPPSNQPVSHAAKPTPAKPHQDNLNIQKPSVQSAQSTPIPAKAVQAAAVQTVAINHESINDSEQTTQDKQVVFAGINLQDIRKQNQDTPKDRAIPSWQAQTANNADHTETVWHKTDITQSRGVAGDNTVNDGLSYTNNGTNDNANDDKNNDKSWTADVIDVHDDYVAIDGADNHHEIHFTHTDDIQSTHELAPNQGMTKERATQQDVALHSSEISNATAFAVESNATNEHTDTHSKPDVHDDEQFAKRSFAMQTAKYRETLSPLPSLELLDLPDPNRKPSYTTHELRQLSELLEIKLAEFRIKAVVVEAIQGPVVTLFEVELAPGLKASKVTSISADLARSLSMPSCRVIEVLPGKPYIGIEVPNRKRGTVRLIELLRADKYTDPKGLLSMAMGTDIGGKPIISDLAKAPHMLVAGTTGSGKSVLMNSVMLSLLLKYTANELRLVLIDPKQVELANYSDIPHLLSPVITDMTEATSALAWCVEEMERRYRLLAAFKVRHVTDLNKKIKDAEAAGESLLDPLWRVSDSVSDTVPRLKHLPFIVVIADEFADLMMQVGKQAEELIVRLAQKSRACGIHLILATQRPSADVVTGLIKSNIPARAALKVAAGRDSSIILGETGAEHMLGNGDMLFRGPEKSEVSRVHGAYVSDSEVNRVCDAWRERGLPDYVDMTSQTSMDFDILTGSPRGGSGDEDALYGDAIAFVMESGKTSISALQRGIGVGYNRAANLVEALEQNGILSTPDRSGKRSLLQGGE